MWKKVPFEKGENQSIQYFNLFVDELEDIRQKRKMKRKNLPISRFLQDDINLKTYCRHCIRDDFFL